MRLRSLALLLSVPSLVATQEVRLESVTGEPRLLASAMKSARLTPDRAWSYVLVEGTGEVPADAVQRANTKVQAVVAALRAAGVGADQLSTMPYGLGPQQTQMSFPSAPPPTSYSARFLVRVQPSRVDQLVPMLAVALAGGGSNASSPTYESSAADSVRRVKLAEALAQARQDAEATAAAMGGKLGAIVEVTSNSSASPFSSSPFLSFNAQLNYSQGGVPEIVVSASASIRYRFLQK